MKSSNRASVIITIILLTVILLVTVFAFLIPPLLTKKYDEKLVIYNWADYIDIEVLDEFAAYYEELTGKSLNIVYSNFDTNETMMTEIIKGDSKIDLICPSEYAIQKLLRHDRLEKLNWNYVTDLGEELYLGNIKKDIREKIDSVFSDTAIGDKTGNMNDYFVPYMWGTLGVLYNTNYLTYEEVKEAGWGIFWNSINKKTLDKKILVKDSIRDTYVCAVMYLKEQNLLPSKYMSYSVQDLITCTDQEMIDLAEKVLEEQRKYLKGYEVDFGKDDMVNETAYVNLAWSGDAAYAIEEAMDDESNSYLDYYVPESGSNIWFDGWVIPKADDDYKPNYRAAHLFLNFLNRPDIALYNTLEIGYASAVENDIYTKLLDSEKYMSLLTIGSWEESYELLDKDYSEDENYYALLGLIALLEGYEIDADKDSILEFNEDFFGDIRRYSDFSHNLGMMQDLGRIEESDNERVVEMWERVKSYGESKNWIILGVLIAILVGLGLLVTVFVLYWFNRPPRPRKLD
ncbi:MAG: extracellular solute-binding protein [Clostridiales bacterium]|nr:extracellular solute-binding protein [Clostridiales bacterium]